MSLEKLSFSSDGCSVFSISRSVESNGRGYSDHFSIGCLSSDDEGKRTKPNRGLKSFSGTRSISTSDKHQENGNGLRLSSSDDESVIDVDLLHDRCNTQQRNTSLSGLTSHMKKRKLDSDGDVDPLDTEEVTPIPSRYQRRTKFKRAKVGGVKMRMSEKYLREASSVPGALGIQTSRSMSTGDKRRGHGTELGLWSSDDDDFVDMYRQRGGSKNQLKLSSHSRLVNAENPRQDDGSALSVVEVIESNHERTNHNRTRDSNLALPSTAHKAWKMHIRHLQAYKPNIFDNAEARLEITGRAQQGRSVYEGIGVTENNCLGLQRVLKFYSERQSLLPSNSSKTAKELITTTSQFLRWCVASSSCDKLDVWKEETLFLNIADIGLVERFVAYFQARCGRRTFISKVMHLSIICGASDQGGSDKGRREVRKFLQSVGPKTMVGAICRILMN